MIGDSALEYVFIRISILGVRLVAPLSTAFVAYCAYAQRIPGPTLPLFCYAAIETGFFFLVYLPRSFLLQRTIEQSTDQLDQKEREKLFHRCLHEYKTETYPAGWFLAPNAQRENVREWLLWAVFSSTPDLALPEWEDELDSYISRIEEDVGKTYEPGLHPKTKSIRISNDSVAMLHRPLIWYMTVMLVDQLTSIYLLIHGYQHYTPWFTGLKAFPPRPLSLFSHTSAAPQFPYWYRPHRSTTKDPVVFIHGIGIGLLSYAALFAELDPDVGVLLIELLPISMRITRDPLSSRREMLGALETIVRTLPGFERYVLTAHSYGTAIAAHILRNGHAEQVKSVVLMDPIPILLHLPDVAYNFLYRTPRRANEWQLWYFASRDPDVAKTLFRSFFWRDCIMWRDDLRALNRAVAVVLSEKDQIVATRDVWDYLTGKADREAVGDRWRGENLEVLWYEGLDHAQVFDTKPRRRRLLDVIDAQCQRVALSD